MKLKMETITKQKIIDACNNNSDEFSFFKTVQIDRQYDSPDKANSYRVEANTVLQIHHNIIGIYSTAKVAVPDKIIVLGYCDNLDFLDSLSSLIETIKLGD